MKECWINVYERDMGINKSRKDDSIRAGNYVKNLELFGKLKYRLHVKLKDKPGLVRRYYCKFDELKLFPSGRYVDITLDRYKQPMKPLRMINHQYSDWAKQ